MEKFKRVTKTEKRPAYNERFGAKGGGGIANLKGTEEIPPVPSRRPVMLDYNQNKL